MLDILIFGMA